MAENPDDGVFKLSGCLLGGRELIAKPVIFLGGTVLSFNASLGIGPTQESTVTVDIINDCAKSGSCTKPEGEYFYGLAKIGAPVYFSVCDAMDLPENGDCFKFGGILQNVTLNQGSSGRTYQARIVDPRSLLANAMLIVGNQLAGPVEHKNYFNVYGHYEHNVLPTGSKYDHAKDAENEAILLEESPVPWQVVNPSGDEAKVDCAVYGIADSDERGMSYRKVVQALKEMEPLIFSPNYALNQSGTIGQRDTQILASRVEHQENVFKFDVTGLPDPPSYYRVAGPTLSILDLITNVCDVMGHEFHVTLEPENPLDPEAFKLWTIKVKTKKAEPRGGGSSIFENIAAYDGSAIDISYGKELRIDKNKTVVFGDQKHEMYLSSDIEFYFGEDKNGDPIIPRVDAASSGATCGFLLDLELDELNAQLECPLFDYSTSQPVKRKVTISEYDLRTALSSVELWKRRVLSSGIPTSSVDKAPDKAGDFNRLIRYNFPDATNAMLNSLIKQASDGKGGNKTNVDGAAAKAFRDLLNFANNKDAAAVTHMWSNQLDKIHGFIENIGRTYYGKQFIVTLDVDMCAIEAGVYDENYFGLGSGVFSSGVAYTGTLCGEDIVIPEGKIYRPRAYTHTPTNDGAWVDPCFSVMGLTGSGAYVENKDDEFVFYSGVSLDFFKTEDSRVGCFAKFSTRDVQITAKAGLIDNTVDEEGNNGDLINPSVAAVWRAPATCGEIKIEDFGNDEYLIIRASGGLCDPPPAENSQQQKDTQVKPINIGQIKTDLQPITAFVKAQVQDRIYIDENSKARAVVEFSAPCIKKPCFNQADFSALLMAVSQALAIGSGVLLQDGGSTDGTTIMLPPSTSGPQSIPVICGIPIVSGALSAQGSVDAAGANSKGFYGSADKPIIIAIPVRNNTQTYGPWYSSNFFQGAGSYGGVSVEQDADFAPWNYGSIGAMDSIATEVVNESRVELTELENGTINYPFWPELPLGFLENGPNLNSLSVVFGGNGITTNYTFQTYTPKFGSLKNLENQALKDSTKNRQRALKIIRDNQIQNGIINRKLKSTKPVAASSRPVPLQNQSTAGRVLVGESYDFNVIHSGSLSGPIVGSGQKTVVALETLEKNILELRYNHSKKAFTALDSIFSPVSISGDGDLPQFGGTYSFDNRLRVSDISPGTMPPFITGVCTPSGVNVTVSGGQHPMHPIVNTYLNPYTNPLHPTDHEWNKKNSNIYGSGNSFNVGHGHDIVGRESGVPGSGIQGSFYTQDDGHIRQQTENIPAGRYSEDYRFLGLKGPLVLHSWGYDTDNRPIPNAIDDEKLIKESGIFLIRSKEGGINGDINLIPSGTCDPLAVGLKDQFLSDWLQKPKTWPVGPVDLRWDRKRSMWVCPPGHSIVLAQIIKDVPEFGEGSGVILQQGESSKIYRQISAPDGKIVQTTGVMSKGCLPTSTGTMEEYEYDSCKNSGVDEYHWIIISVGDYNCNPSNPQGWIPTGTGIEIVTGLERSSEGCLFAIKKEILLPHNFLIRDVTYDSSGNPSCVIQPEDFCPCEPPTEPPPTEPPTPTPTPDPSPTPTPDPDSKNILFKACCEDDDEEFEPKYIIVAPYENSSLEVGDVIPIDVELESSEHSGASCWIVEGFNVNPEGYTKVSESDIVSTTPNACGCVGCRRQYPCPTPTPTPTPSPTPQPTDPCNLIAVIKIKDYIGKQHNKGDFVYAYYDAESDVYIILGSADMGKNMVTARWDFRDCTQNPGSLTISCSLMSTVRAGTTINSICNNTGSNKIHNPLGFTEPPPGCYTQVMAIGYIPFDTNNTANATCS